MHLYLPSTEHYFPNNSNATSFTTDVNIYQNIPKCKPKNVKFLRYKHTFIIKIREKSETPKALNIRCIFKPL